MAYPSNFPPAAAAASQPALDISTYQDFELTEYLFGSIHRIDSAALNALLSSQRWKLIPISTFRTAYRVARNINAEFGTPNSQFILEALTKFLASHRMIDSRIPLPATSDSAAEEPFPYADDLPDAVSVIEPDPFQDLSEEQFVNKILDSVRSLDSGKIYGIIASNRTANLSRLSIQTILGKIPASSSEVIQRLASTLERLLKIKAAHEAPPAPPAVPAAAAAPAAVQAAELDVSALSDKELGAKLMKCVREGDSEQFSTLIASERDLPVHYVQLAIRAGRTAVASTGSQSIREMVGYLESLLKPTK